MSVAFSIVFIIMGLILSLLVLAMYIITLAYCHFTLKERETEDEY